METNIHRKEEAIQSVWLKMAEANSDAESLCTDGLLFRGPISMPTDIGVGRKVRRRPFGGTLPASFLSSRRISTMMKDGMSVRRRDDIMR